MEFFKNLKPVHGIVFDLEGTIINLEPLHYSAHLKAAADIGLFLDIDEAIRLFPHFIGGPDENVAEEIAAYAKINITSKEILNKKQKYFNDYLIQNAVIKPRDGFIDFLKWINKLELKIAIGSVTSYKQVYYLLKKSHLLDVFNKDQIVAREDVVNPKPDPEVYLKTAERIGILPANQIVFEDSLIGVRAAYDAGCRVIALPTVSSQIFKETLIKEGAEAVFETWYDPDIKMIISNL